MISTIVNALVVIIGSLIGIAFRSKLSKRYTKTITQGLGLCVIVIGVSAAMESSNMIISIVSVSIGSLIGTWLDIESRLDHMGDYLQNRFAKEDENGNFAKGFVTASMVFCVGAMAIVGSMDAALRGDHSTIYAKSILDFVTSIFFAGTYGIGVMASALTVLIYQGAIVLLSQFVEPILTTAVITEMGAVGGVLVIGVGMNVLRREHTFIGNMLPAILIPALIMPFIG